MARVIAISNQKGGAGKTTTAVNLGARLAKFHKKRTLLMDMDPQAHCTLWSGINPGSFSVSIYHIITQNLPLKQCLIEAGENLFLAPADARLSRLRAQDVRLMKSPFLLTREEADSYDFTIIDCPPAMGLPTLFALASASELIIPVQTQFLALERTIELIKNLRVLRQKFNRRLRLGGIVCTMYDPRTNISREVVGRLQRLFGDKVFKTIIHRDVRLEECPAHRKSIFEYSPNSNAAKQYEEFTEEVLKSG
ncbi:MAG: ParA family protein [Deltaproteobacteria bacterium]|nr:MAG: ParA family protein [Deltaproteobacteria bacterium]